MYRPIDRSQYSFLDFNQPMGLHMNPSNRWVKMADSIPCLAVSDGDFDSFFWAVKEKVHSLLSFDLIEWDAGVSEELKKEIEKDGVVIYEKA